MKISATILALYLSQAFAFNPPAPRAFEQATPLGAEIPTLDSGASTGVTDMAPAASISSAQALGARLDALQQGSLAENGDSPDNVWARSTPITVQGGSLKTWSFVSPSLERVHVVMKTEGRPLDADLELWQGPDNTPTKMRVYIEDGALRPFSAHIETPRQGPNTVAIRNTANLEFPLVAAVAAGSPDAPGAKLSEGKSMIIQGGALRTYPFDPLVGSVQILLMTDGRPLNARVELLQGPNNNKEVIELYTEDGMDRPFYAVLATPGSGNVIRVVNTATVEFPLTAWVEPYMVVDSGVSDMEPVIGGGDGSNFMTK